MKRDLGALEATRFDLAIVGGGIAGACVARDAALRGLRVALVERGDFGAGASHNSLRLVHSGLRYAQNLDLLRMRQSAAELKAWLTVAPHLVRPLPVVVPARGTGLRGPAALAAGATLYRAATAGLWTGAAAALQPPPPTVIGRGEARALNPWLEAAGLTGGLLWHDGQLLDPDRLLQEILADAADAGAVLANHVTVEALRPARVGALLLCRDRIGGGTVRVTARLAVNAAGAAAADLLPGMAGALPRFARAVNLVTRPLGPDRALGLSGDGRLFFVTPGRGFSLVGTGQFTDAAPAGPAGFVDTDVDLFLAEFARACPALGLQRRDVRHVQSGLIPAGADGRQLARRPALVDHGGPDGPAVISVLANKYTTARLLAERAVDLAVRRLGLRVAPCRTAGRLLPGARLAMQRPGAADPAALARWAVRSTMACGLDDIVLRRLPLEGLLALGDTGLLALSRAVAVELGQTEAQRRADLDALDLILAQHRGTAPASRPAPRPDGAPARRARLADATL